jgi:transposase
MQMLADQVDAVVGVDTHRDTHTAVVLNPVGRALAETTVTNDEDGFAALVGWLAQHAPGPRIVVAIEGSRSYGIGLARHLAAAGFQVLEIEQPKRKERRRGKSDPIDARLAARHALELAADRLPQPRADGDREALRILLNSREQMTLLQTGQANRLHALLLCGDEDDRNLSRGKFTLAKLERIISRQHDPNADRAQAVRRTECRRLAQAVRDLTRELNENEKQLAGIVEEMAPGLLAKRGVGPVSAATAIIAFSHPGRFHSEAAFAALAGTSPVPTGSGQTSGRHRLNRGGDRQLNRAIHTIARSRMTTDPTTRAYAERRHAEGKTNREIIRCLKRYIARQLYRELTAAMTIPSPALTPAA